jgi:hypothetical protein
MVPLAVARMSADPYASGSILPKPVLVVGGIVFVAALWVLARRYWTYPAGESRTGGDHAERGFVCIALSMSFLFLALTMNLFENYRWVTTAVARIVGLTLAGLAVLSALAFLTVFLFNQPKFLVPPPQRGQAGRLSRQAARP